MYKDDYDNLQLRLSTEAKKNMVFTRSYAAKVNPSNTFHNFSSLFQSETILKTKK